MLDWAASGAMALTGMPDGAPVASPAPALAMLGQVTAELARATGETGHAVRADPAELITGRAALAGLTRGGRVSAGGSSFLLRSADGWCAVTLSRPDDVAAVPAIAGLLGASLDGASLDGTATLAAARAALTAVARGTPAEDLAAAAQLVGVPAAALPASGPPSAPAEPAPGESPGWPPWRAERIAAPLAGARLAGAVVADLSSMWAGPLCARLLGLAGAEVIKVESPARPDGARSGNGEFFDWLHAGHRSLSADFGTRAGRTALLALLEVADVVIEASRPRALAALGLAPDMLSHRPGQVWLSITGYGRAEPGRVAFGDDAAVAGGLVGWAAGESSPEPVFCADAIADPLAGACGALAVALSLSAGGGELIDLSMRDVAAAFAAPGQDIAPGHGPHDVLPGRVSGLPAAGTASRPCCRHAARAPRPRGAGEGGRAPELGADTGAVLAWLAGRRAPHADPQRARVAAGCPPGRGSGAGRHPAYRRAPGRRPDRRVRARPAAGTRRGRHGGGRRCPAARPARPPRAPAGARRRGRQASASARRRPGPRPNWPRGCAPRTRTCRLARGCAPSATTSRSPGRLTATLWTGLSPGARCECSTAPARCGWSTRSRGTRLGLDECELGGVERDDDGRPTGRLWRMDRWLAGPGARCDRGPGRGEQEGGVVRYHGLHGRDASCDRARPRLPGRRADRAAPALHGAAGGAPAVRDDHHRAGQDNARRRHPAGA